MKNLYIKPVTEIYDMDIDTMMQTVSDPGLNDDYGHGQLVKDKNEDNWEEL